MSTLSCVLNTVNLCDGLYKDIDTTTRATFAHLLGNHETVVGINMGQVMQQVRERTVELLQQQS